MKHGFCWPGTLVLVILMTFLSVAIAAQDLYRWVDADGNVYYSDQRPPVDAKDVSAIKGGERSSADELQEGVEEADSYAEQEAEFQERREENTAAEAKAKKEADIAAQRGSNCTMARRNLEVLTNPPGGRVREANAAGELIYVPEEKRQQQMVEAAEAIKEWCKS